MGLGLGLRRGSGRLKKGFFLGTSQLFDGRLPDRGRGTVGMALLVDQLDGQPRPGVTRGLASQMAVQTALEIIGDARVETAVGAFQDVDKPLGLIHDRPMQVPSLKNLQSHALRLVQNPERLGKLVQEADAKAQAHQTRIGAFWLELKTLLRLLRAYLTGTYRDVPWKTLLAAVGAVLYFLNPLDLIADFIYAFGFIDDALVVGLVLASIRGDLEKFSAWEQNAKILTNAD